MFERRNVRKIGNRVRAQQPNWPRSVRPYSFAGMKRFALLPVVGLIAIGACDREASVDTPAGDGGDARPGRAGAPSVTTEYTTSLLFLPYEATATRAMILDFANTATSDSLSHRYLGWQLLRQGWASVLDVDARDRPLREPWRLFPVDSLRLTVNADGDPNALILQAGTRDHTLDLGEPLDRWEDGAGTQHEIRQAIWSQRGQRLNGIAVQHRFAVSEPDYPARFGPYQRAVLRSEDGAIIVLFNNRDPEKYGDSYAWMYADGLTRRWTAVESRTVEVANSTQLRRNVPIRIWFQIPEPDIQGELTAAERQFNELPAEGGPKPYHALYRVRGWLEFAGERRNVEGLLERGEP